MESIANIVGFEITEILHTSIMALFESLENMGLLMKSRYLTTVKTKTRRR